MSSYGLMAISPLDKPGALFQGKLKNRKNKNFESAPSPPSLPLLACGIAWIGTAWSVVDGSPPPVSQKKENLMPLLMVCLVVGCVIALPPCFSVLTGNRRGVVRVPARERSNPHAARSGGTVKAPQMRVEGWGVISGSEFEL